MKITSSYTVIDETIVGFNLELADMGNPDGAIFGRMIFVFAETREGRRFVHERQFDLSQAEVAEKLAAKVARKAEINPIFWGETFEIYGSQAWGEHDNQRALAHQSSPLAGTVRDY